MTRPGLQLEVIIHRANFNRGSQGKRPKITMVHSSHFNHSKGEKGHDVANSQKPRQEEKKNVFIYQRLHGLSEQPADEWEGRQR